MSDPFTIRENEAWSGQLPFQAPATDPFTAAEVVAFGGRPEWDDPGLSLNDRVQDFMNVHLKAGTPWDSARGDMQKRFNVEPNQFKNYYRLSQERDKQSREDESYLEMIAQRMPYGGAIGGAARAERFRTAIGRLNKNEANDDDYAVIARYERLQELQAKREETTLGAVTQGLTHLPAVVVEGLTGGRLLKGLGVFGKARAAQAGLVGRAAPVVAQTAIMPSMYLQQGAQNRVEDPERSAVRGYGSAFIYGALQTAILGQMAKAADTPGGLIPRLKTIAGRTPLGMAEQQGVDLIAGGVQKAVDALEGDGKDKARFGLLGDYIKHGAEGKEFQKHFAVQAVTFAAFASFHKTNPEATFKEMQAEFDRLMAEGATPDVGAKSILESNTRVMRAMSEIESGRPVDAVKESLKGDSYALKILNNLKLEEVERAGLLLNHPERYSAQVKLREFNRNMIVESATDLATRKEPAKPEEVVDREVAAKEEPKPETVQVQEQPTQMPEYRGAPTGWKLHLASNKPEEVSAVLKELGLKHKVGRSGQEGKDITVYVGDKDAAIKAADAIRARAGDLLGDPRGETLKDDVPFGDKVMGRFDVPLDPEFHQYGSEGVPHLKSDIDPWNKKPNAKERAIKRLEEKYGTNFTGSKSVQVQEQPPETAKTPEKPPVAPEPPPVEPVASEKPQEARQGVEPTTTTERPPEAEIVRPERAEVPKEVPLPKGEDATRALAEILTSKKLPPVSVHVVSQWMQGRPLRDIVADPESVNPKGKPYSHEGIRKIVQRVFKRVGLDMEAAERLRAQTLADRAALDPNRVVDYGELAAEKGVKEAVFQTKTKLDKISNKLDDLAEQFLKENERGEITAERRQEYESEARRITEGGSEPGKGGVKKVRGSAEAPPGGPEATKDRGTETPGEEGTALFSMIAPPFLVRGLDRAMRWFLRAGKPIYVPGLKTDNTTDLPRYGPQSEFKAIFTNPQGAGRIPGLARLMGDARATERTPDGIAIAAHAVQNQIGRNIFALWALTHERANDLFPKRPDGMIELANGKLDYMSDAIEREMARPGSVDFTDAQRNFVHKVWTPLLRNLQKMMKDEGVANYVDEDGNVMSATAKAYFPRRAIGKKELPEPSGPGSPASSRPGAKATFEHARKFESEKAGVESKEQLVYDPRPVSRIADFISGVYRSVADNRLANDPAIRGRVPTKNDPEIWLREKRVYSAPAFQGKVFPMETAARLERYYGRESNEWIKGIEKVSSTAKGIMLGADQSYPFVQGLIFMYNHPVRWAKATVGAYRALFDPEVMRRALADPETMAAAREIVQGGGSIGRLMDFMSSMGEGGVLAKAPGFKQFGRAFGVFMDLAKIEMWKAWRSVTPKDQWVGQIEAIENLLGQGRMEGVGLSPGRAMTERLFLLAPSYYRSLPNLVATAFQRGMPGYMTRIALGKFMAGVSLTAYGLMHALGLSDDEIEQRFDPSRGKFLKVPVELGNGKKVEVGFGNLIISTGRLIGDSAEYMNSKNPIDTGTDGNPILRYLRGKGAVAPRLAIDIFTGKDYFGNRVGVAESTLRAFEPLVLQQILHGEGSAYEKGISKPEAPGRQNLADAAFSFFGFTSYPGNPNDARMQFINNKALELYKKDWDKLSLTEQSRVMRVAERSPGIPAKAKPSPQAVERMIALRAERSTRLTESLSPGSRDRLTALGKELPSYDGTLALNGTEVPMSRETMKRYEGLIAEEYEKTIQRWDMNRLPKLSPFQRNKFMTDSLELAKERAKIKLLRGKEATPQEKAPPRPSLLGYGPR